MIKKVTLETAKKLKEKGFNKTCYFFWARRKDVINGGHYEHDVFHTTEHGLIDIIQAPSINELLEELPRGIEIKKYERFAVRYIPKRKGRRLCRVHQDLPEALAQMWLWLKKEGLI